MFFLLFACLSALISVFLACFACNMSFYMSSTGRSVRTAEAPVTKCPGCNRNTRPEQFLLNPSLLLSASNPIETNCQKCRNKLERAKQRRANRRERSLTTLTDLSPNFNVIPYSRTRG